MSLFNITSSEDEYVPASSEASSDKSSEQSSQTKRCVKGLGFKLHKQRPETSLESKNGSDGLSGAKMKRQGMEAGVHSREKDSGESRPKTKKRHKKRDKRCSSLSKEEDSGESRLKKRRYKKSDKRCTISQVESDPDDSASKRRKKNRKTYTRLKESTDGKKRDSLLVVADVLKVDGSKKYHLKKNYCLYYREPQSKIARHLERKHEDKREVASAVMYANNSKERRNQLDLLRKKGNRAHNIDALTKGEGTLVPCKQQNNSKSNPKDYQHCFACFGYFKRKSLWKHAKRCSLIQSVRKTLPGKTRIQTLCASAQPAP